MMREKREEGFFDKATSFLSKIIQSKDTFWQI